MTRGDAVRILIRAGAVDGGTAATATRFVGTVEPGQVGVYQGPLPGRLWREGWHVVRVGAWDVPLHESQFEALPHAGGQP